MSLTLLMTMHNRPPEVMNAVFASLTHFMGNSCYDDLVIVNDRGDRVAIERALDEASLTARIVQIDGPPGHRGQASAWNRGYEAVTTTHVACMSSDCILLPWSIQNLRWFADNLPEFIVFGRAEHCGRNYTTKFVQLDGKVVSTKTILDYKNGMPEGYIWSLPMGSVRELGGWDEEMTNGVCFDHTDLFYRIMEKGIPWVRSDDVAAVHIEHSKDHIADKEAVERNRVVFERKHGKHDSDGWLAVARMAYVPMVWEHPPLSFWVNQADSNQDNFDRIRELVLNSYLAKNPLTGMANAT